MSRRRRLSSPGATAVLRHPDSAGAAQTGGEVGTRAVLACPGLRPAAEAPHSRRDATRVGTRRTLNSLIAMLFVYRLVPSDGRKGRATVLAEQWEQCRRLGVELPQPQAAAISSIAKVSSCRAL